MRNVPALLLLPAAALALTLGGCASFGKKKYTPRELTSRDSVVNSPIADPLVQRTIMGSRI